MIELRSLTCSYGAKTTLENASAVFPDGKITAILGPNGAGKSTLVETVVGLHEEFQGDILIDGCSTSSLSPTERAKKVAYMSQNRTIPHIVASRMVLHGRFPHLGYPRKYHKQDYEIAAASLKAVGAEELAHRPMTDMSGGQRQKVYIAMALAQTTQNILMDEPTNFLDIHSQQELMQLARSMADDGKAIIMVLHDIRMALETADRILVLSEGKIAGSGSADEIYGSGIIDTVFRTRLRRLETPSGLRYYYE